MNNKALIIVDMQNGFNNNSDTKEIEEKLANIDKNDYDMIIATKFVNDEAVLKRCIGKKNVI